MVKQGAQTARSLGGMVKKLLEGNCLAHPGPNSDWPMHRGDGKETKSPSLSPFFVSLPGHITTALGKYRHVMCPWEVYITQRGQRSRAKGPWQWCAPLNSP